MISEKLVQEFNQQICREFESAYLYLSMAAYCKSQSLDGFENWMLLQAQEEIGHAMKIYNYVLDRGRQVTLAALPQPRSTFKSMQEVFQVALDNEVDLDKKLNGLANAALAERDNTSHVFLEWFLTEQVEEVSTCNTILDKLKLIGDNGYGLLALNDEMAQRQSAETPE
jgi:ferritin